MKNLVERIRESIMPDKRRGVFLDNEDARRICDAIEILQEALIPQACNENTDKCVVCNTLDKVSELLK